VRDTSLDYTIEVYECELCSIQQGRPVVELVRMIPAALTFAGTLIGDEAWCCPVCRTAKFDLKRRRIDPNRPAKRRSRQRKMA
jgi:hypothetical protein